MSNLIQRIITASILLPLAIVLIFYMPNHYFALTSLLVSFFIVLEFVRINKINNTKTALITVVLLLFVMALVFGGLDSKGVILYFFVITALWWLFNIFIVVGYPRNNHFVAKEAFKPLNGLLLFVPFVVSFILLQKENPRALLLLLLIVVVADSFAYFSGKLFGKHKLHSLLSGGKTIEGVLGGVFFAFAFAQIYVVFVLDYSFLSLWLVILLTAIFSVIGDLYQSIYKRIAGVKDSGNILPGHGGAWDRTDGLLAASPIFYLGYLW